MGGGGVRACERVRVCVYACVRVRVRVHVRTHLLDVAGCMPPVFLPSPPRRLPPLPPEGAGAAVVGVGAPAPHTALPLQPREASALRGRGSLGRHPALRGWREPGRRGGAVGPEPPRQVWRQQPGRRLHRRCTRPGRPDRQLGGSGCGGAWEGGCMGMLRGSVCVGEGKSGHITRQCMRGRGDAWAYYEAVHAWVLSMHACERTWLHVRSFASMHSRTHLPTPVWVASCSPADPP